jgi:hypothetical protein
MANTMVNNGAMAPGPIHGTVTTTKLITYNLHGFNQGSSLLAHLCENKLADFIFVQEHWLYSEYD